MNKSFRIFETLGLKILIKKDLWIAGKSIAYRNGFWRERSPGICEKSPGRKEEKNELTYKM
jgi:hypothetical protein